MCIYINNFKTIPQAYKIFLFILVEELKPAKYNKGASMRLGKKINA